MPMNYVTAWAFWCIRALPMSARHIRIICLSSGKSLHWKRSISCAGCAITPVLPCGAAAVNLWALCWITVGMMCEKNWIWPSIRLAPIFSAREQNTYGVSSEDLAKRIPGAEVAADLRQAAQMLGEQVQPGDLIFTMGAGDVCKLVQYLN